MEKIEFEQLLTMSLDDLRELNQMIIDTIKIKKDLMGKEISRKLSIDQEIEINHSKHKGDIFIITKINQKKAVVRLKDTTKFFDVPFELIKIIDK